MLFFTYLNMLHNQKKNFRYSLTRDQQSHLIFNNGMCNVIILIKAKLELPLCHTFFINSIESLLVSENIRTAAK